MGLPHPRVTSRPATGSRKLTATAHPVISREENSRMLQRQALFGASLGQWNGADIGNVAGVLELATTADANGLDLFTIADHLYFGDKLDAYSTVGFALGRTSRIAGLVAVTCLPTR